MRRRVSTMRRGGAKNGVTEGAKPPSGRSKARRLDGRIGINIKHVLAGDGSESGSVIVTCPFCMRSLPLDQNTVSEHLADSALDHPRSTPSFSSVAKVSPSREPPRQFGTGIVPSAAHGPISTVMTRDVVCVRHDLSIEALTKLFLERGLHGAPVLDGDGELVGFISMTDLLRNRYEASDTEETIPLRVRTRSGGVYDLGNGFRATQLARATVGELMMPLAISLEESAPISMAAALMSFEGVHRIPVVSESGKVVGILSSLDLLRWLALEDGYQPPPSELRIER